MEKGDIRIGEQAVVKNPAYIGGAFAKIGTVKELDDNAQPGELFAVMDIEGEEYCFNIRDLEQADKR